MRTRIRKTLWLVALQYGYLRIGTIIAVEETKKMYYLDDKSYITYIGARILYSTQINKSEIGSKVFLTMIDAFRHASGLADTHIKEVETKLTKAKGQKMELVKLSAQLVSEGKHREE